MLAEESTSGRVCTARPPIPSIRHYVRVYLAAGPDTHPIILLDHDALKAALRLLLRMQNFTLQFTPYSYAYNFLPYIEAR